MPDLKISQLTAGSLAQAGDEIPIARSGANYKITGADIAAAATSVGTLTSLTLSGNVTLNATNGVMQIVTPTADQPQIRMRMSSTDGVLDVTRNSGTAPNLIFGTEGAEKMRLDANGNLGIGGSPSYKLHLISGSAADIETGVTNSAGYSRFGTRSSGNSFVGAFTAAKSLELWSAGSLNATLDASGNLGLGVTPSAWITGSRAAQLSTVTAVYQDFNGGANFGQNAYESADGVFRYLVNFYATRYHQQSGQHRWYTAPSGTAGNVITFTQAMTLDASGNLGIGVSPSTKLHVSGGTTRIQATSDGNDGILRVTDTAVSTQVQTYATSTTGYMGVVESKPLVLLTNNTERARITSGGYFKASDDGTYSGSTASYHELRSSGTASDWTVYISNKNATAANVYGVLIGYSNATPNGTGNEFLLCNDATATRAVIRSNGGLANYQSNNVDLSDARTKTDISPAASMWGKVAALEIVSYKYIDQTHDDVNLGVIAQQVETVEPVWVDADGFGETPEGEEPLKTVYTKDITFAAIKALQEAMARIESLEARLAALES